MRPTLRESVEYSPEHRAALEALARALLQAESLDENEIREATGLGGLPAEPDAPSRLLAGKPGGQASLAGKR